MNTHNHSYRALSHTHTHAGSPGVSFRSQRKINQVTSERVSRSGIQLLSLISELHSARLERSAESRPPLMLINGAATVHQNTPTSPTRSPDLPFTLKASAHAAPTPTAARRKIKVPLSLWKRQAWKLLLFDEWRRKECHYRGSQTHHQIVFKDSNPPKTDHLGLILIQNIIQMLNHPKNKNNYYINLKLRVKRLQLLD